MKATNAAILSLVSAFVFQMNRANAFVTDFTKLESISYDEVCGLSSSGKTKCFKGQESPTWVPDPVGKISEAYQNDIFGCGKDGASWSCWKMTAGLIKGVTLDEKFRKLLENAKPNTVQLSISNLCGVDKKSSSLHCLMPYWNSGSQEIQKKPKTEIRAIGAHDNYVCWADGDKIECQFNYQPWPIPKKMELTKPVEIKLGDSFLCARSLDEAKCWSDKSTPYNVPTVMPLEIAKAQTWMALEDSICAFTTDQRIVCANPTSGALLDPQQQGSMIPVSYQQPNSDVQNVWGSESYGCVNLKNGSVQCWTWWSGSANAVDFREPVERLFGSGSTPCGILQSGQVECRMYYIDSSTLPKPDRVRVEFGGYNRCFWNSGGIECRGRTEKIEFKSVKSVSTASSGEVICVVGVQRSSPSDFDSVRCFTYNTDLVNPPFDLSNPIAVAASEERACAVSDEGLTCWGTGYQGSPPPTNVSNPKKLLMATSHGCILDDFGFACWGDLANLQLEIPAGLDQPGKVTDFALGTSRTCVTLDTGDVECWGRDFDRSGPPPKLSKTTSILGRGSLFCALADSGLHCWGGYSDLPR